MSAGMDAGLLTMAAMLRVLGVGLVVFRILEVDDAFGAVVKANLRFWMVGAMFIAGTMRISLLVGSCLMDLEFLDEGYMIQPFPIFD